MARWIRRFSSGRTFPRRHELLCDEWRDRALLSIAERASPDESLGSGSRFSVASFAMFSLNALGGFADPRFKVANRHRFQLASNFFQFSLILTTLFFPALRLLDLIPPSGIEQGSQTLDFLLARNRGFAQDHGFSRNDLSFDPIERLCQTGFIVLTSALHTVFVVQARSRALRQSPD